MEHDNAVSKLMEYSHKLEVRESETQKFRSRLDALLEQANT